MTSFKFTTDKGEIIHVTSRSPENIFIECKGEWSSMTAEEQELFFQQLNEQAELNPLPQMLDPEPITPQQKLESIGLTVNELRQLLAVNENQAI